MFEPRFQVPVILPVELVTPVMDPVTTSWRKSKPLAVPLAESNEELPTVNTASRRPLLKTYRNNLKAESGARLLIVKLELPSKERK